MVSECNTPSSPYMTFKLQIFTRRVLCCVNRALSRCISISKHLKCPSWERENLFAILDRFFHIRVSPLSVFYCASWYLLISKGNKNDRKKSPLSSSVIPEALSRCFFRYFVGKLLHFCSDGRFSWLLWRHLYWLQLYSSWITPSLSCCGISGSEVDEVPAQVWLLLPQLLETHLFDRCNWVNGFTQSLQIGIITW